MMTRKQAQVSATRNGQALYACHRCRWWFGVGTLRELLFGWIFDQTCPYCGGPLKKEGSDGEAK